MNNKAIAFFSGFPDRRFTAEIARRLEKDLPVRGNVIQIRMTERGLELK